MTQSIYGIFKQVKIFPHVIHDDIFDVTFSSDGRHIASWSARQRFIEIVECRGLEKAAAHLGRRFRFD